MGDFLAEKCLFGKGVLYVQWVFIARDLNEKG